MYHSISDQVESRSHPYFKTVTSPSCFALQMDWLAEAGAEVISLDTWNSSSSEGSSPRVIITFDDGFEDFKKNAFPILRAHGYTATMFLPTAYIETGKELVSGVQHLAWGDVEQLSSAGFSFGSHTVHHFHLDNLSPAEIHKEVETSAEIIRTHVAEPVTSFSCPFAFPQAHAKVIAALRESLTDCGYTAAVTTKIGTVSTHDDPYTLKRLPINSDDDKKLFMAKLNGGYDWLYGIQRTSRSVKRILHHA